MSFSRRFYPKWLTISAFNLESKLRTTRIQKVIFPQYSRTNHNYAKRFMSYYDPVMSIFGCFCFLFLSFHIVTSSFKSPSFKYIRAVKRLQFLIRLITGFCGLIMINHIYTFIHRGAHNLLTSARASIGALPRASREELLTGDGGGGGGAIDFFSSWCARTGRHPSSAARDTEIGAVLTRHVETKWHAAG